jgi:hypothetical protein
MSWYDDLTNLNNKLSEGVRNGSSPNSTTNSFYDKLKNLNKELTQGVYDASSSTGKKIIDNIYKDVRELQSQPPTDKNSPPPKADSAPSPNTITVFTGLCDALNTFQKTLKEKGLCEIPDQYEIRFSPKPLGSEKVQLTGTTNYKIVGMSSNTNSAKNKLPNTNRMDSNTRIIDVTAGTQIVQFIDQVMRTSTYITKQASGTIDSENGTFTPDPKLKNSTRGINWYKITFKSENLGWDSIRGLFAYKMTFIINQFSITDLRSQFFSPGAFRGVHKLFNYWFTGQNTQVLNFEQDYNTMFYQILTAAPDGTGAATSQSLKDLKNIVNSSNNDNAPSVSKSYSPGFSVSSQYAPNGAALIGSSAADWLYGLTDKGIVRLRVVGDPGLILQGELTNGITAENFNYTPFFEDGSINSDIGQVLFGVIFNRPADYNFETGLVDTEAQNITNGIPDLLQPQARLTYLGKTIVSTFRQGKFEQELEGVVYQDTFNLAREQQRENVRAASKIKGLQSIINPNNPFTFAGPLTGTVRAPTVDTTNLNLGGLGVGPSGQFTFSSPNPPVSPNTGFISNPPNQTAAPPEPVNSNGEVVSVPASIANSDNPFTFNGGGGLSSNSISNGLQTDQQLQTMAPGDDSSN